MEKLSIKRLLAAHAAWSTKTFGNVGPIGPLNHLIEEAGEAIDRPAVVEEYVDCMFLTFDAARRAGFSLDDIISGGWEKLSVLETRKFETPVDGEPCHHVKSEEAEKDFALKASYALLKQGVERGYFDLSSDDYQNTFDCISDALGEPEVVIEDEDHD